MITTQFPDRAVMAELMAKMLWEIGAVHFRPQEPYKLASGMFSPVYIDCRKLLSYPRIRSTIMDFCRLCSASGCGFEKFDMRGRWRNGWHSLRSSSGRSSGASDDLCAQAAQGHGRNAQIEGHMPEGARVLVIEDLTTVGGSMFKFIDAVRAPVASWITLSHSSTMAFSRRRKPALPMAR